MRSFLWILGMIVVASLILAGCSKEESGGGAASGDATTDTGTTVMDDAKKVADEAVTKAKEMLDQVTGYIKDQKLDLVDPLLQKLQGMKGSLPESLQKQIDSAQQAFTAAKAATGDVKIPGGLPIKK